MLSSTSPMLEFENLSCERDERVLFADLSVNFFPGEVVQIVGPNGAGKTTLLRAVAGITHDYGGEIRYRGKTIRESAWNFASDCLYLGHLPGIKKALSPLENLSWYTAQTGAAVPVETALATVGLYGYEDTPCYQLSAGQLRRVALARLHLSQARIWILDEPFTAIDKAGVAELEALMSQHCNRSGLVLLTSHQDLALERLRLIDLQDYQPRGSLGRESLGEGN